MNYKFNICDTVFCKFRGKWDIGTVEFEGRGAFFPKKPEGAAPIVSNYYCVRIKGAKRLQRKLEHELKPTLKLDENGNIIVPKE